jgi:hypothetical protein
MSCRSIWKAAFQLIQREKTIVWSTTHVIGCYAQRKSKIAKSSLCTNNFLIEREIDER